MVRLASDGSFELDMRYFEFLRSPERSFSRKFVDVFVSKIAHTTRCRPGSRD